MRCTCALVHGDSEGLGPAHTAQAGGQGQGPGQGAAEALVSSGTEGLIGPLEDALGADVDPRSRGHLAVHHQPGALELSKVLPVGPLTHQHGIREQDAGSVRMGLEDTDSLAGLNQHGLVVTQSLQRLDDPIEARPVPGGLAAATIDDELIGVLGHLRVEVVQEHSVGSFLNPATAGQFRSVGCPGHRPCSVRHGALHRQG